MKNSFALLRLSLVILSLALTAGLAADALHTELGVLDLEANGGINPATAQPWQVGDTYRFIFVTSQLTNALSTDITDYNSFVQDVANGSSYGVGGAQWRALASTATGHARDNTETRVEVHGTGEAIFLVNGSTIIFTNSVDLWDGHNPAKPFKTEQMTAPPNVKTYGDTWTGIYRNPYPDPNYGTADSAPMGNAGGTAMCGLPGGTGTQWIWRWGNATSDELPMYALSLPLEIKGPAGMVLIFQ